MFDIFGSLDGLSYFCYNGSMDFPRNFTFYNWSSSLLKIFFHSLFCRNNMDCIIKTLNSVLRQFNWLNLFQVFEKPLLWSTAEIKPFAENMKNKLKGRIFTNSRPVQPLNKRIVKLYQN